MASAFAHAVVGAALWPLFRVEDAPKNTWLIGAATVPVRDLQRLETALAH